MKPHRRQRTLIVAGAIVGSILYLFFLTLFPIPQAFTLENAAIYDLQTVCPGIDTVAGTAVHFQWSTAAPMIFFVVSCSAQQVAYEGNGTHGSGTFVSVGGVYEFGSSCAGPYTCYPARVVGTYSGPLLPI
jgi:hypothetical protein